MSVKWDGQIISLQINKHLREAMGAVAVQLEGMTKVNITTNGQIDTGFMRASVYSRDAEQSSYANTEERRHGVVMRLPEAEVPSEAVALVGVAAEYAVFQELRESFLYRAVLEIAPQVGSIIQSAMQ